MKNLKIIGWIVAVIITILLAGFIYTSFFKPVYGGGQNVIGLIIFGLIIGAIIAFLIVKLANVKKKKSSTVVSSHTVVESMKKVFKIVVAEGQLNEIYNYENTKKLLKFIPSTKKALVIVRAKVLVGYDIEKCKWQANEETKTITLLEFPKPEILSLEPDFNYYYFEDDLFNFINRKDLQEIQDLAKNQVRKVAQQSNLMKIASDQMKTLLTEVVGANQWGIENLEKVEDYKYLPDPEEETIEAEEVESGHSLTKMVMDKAAKLFDF